MRLRNTRALASQRLKHNPPLHIVRAHARIRIHHLQHTHTSTHTLRRNQQPSTSKQRDYILPNVRRRSLPHLPLPHAMASKKPFQQVSSAWAISDVCVCALQMCVYSADRCLICPHSRNFPRLGTRARTRALRDSSAARLYANDWAITTGKPNAGQRCGWMARIAIHFALLRTRARARP